MLLLFLLFKRLVLFKSRNNRRESVFTFPERKARCRAQSHTPVPKPQWKGVGNTGGKIKAGALRKGGTSLFFRTRKVQTKRKALKGFLSFVFPSVSPPPTATSQLRLVVSFGNEVYCCCLCAYASDEETRRKKRRGKEKEKNKVGRKREKEQSIVFSETSSFVSRFSFPSHSFVDRRLAPGGRVRAREARS